MFQLDPAFPATSHLLGDLALCQARLQADARYAWIVLLPRVAGARELEDLTADQRRQLMDEILLAGEAARSAWRWAVRSPSSMSASWAT